MLLHFRPDAMTVVTSPKVQTMPRHVQQSSTDAPFDIKYASRSSSLILPTARCRKRFASTLLVRLMSLTDLLSIAIEKNLRRENKQKKLHSHMKTLNIKICNEKQLMPNDKYS